MRFKLKTALILIGVAAVVFAIIAASTEKWRERRRVTRELENLGAYYVAFDDDNHLRWASFSGRILEPGLSRYKNIHFLDLNESSVTDADLDHIVDVDVFYLMLARTKISDSGIERLAKIHHLDVLDISDTPITDAGMPAIASIKGLRGVCLSGTMVTVHGVESLKLSRPDIWVTHDTIGVRVDADEPYDATERRSRAN